MKKFNQRLGWLNKLILTIFLIFGVGLVFLFLYLHNSIEVKQYLNRVSDENSTIGLRLTIFYGIVKVLSLIVGLVITVKILHSFVTINKTNRNPWNVSPKT